MKKISLIGLISLIALVLLVTAACSNGTSVNEEVAIMRSVDAELSTATIEDNADYTIAFDELNAQLLQLNDVYPAEIQSRGPIWRWFKRIVLGDFLGAILGTAILPGSVISGVVGAIYGSICAAQFTYSTEVGAPSEPIEVTVNPNINTSSLQSAINSGYLHNLVIYEIYEDYGNNIYTMNDNTLRTKIAEYVGRYVLITNNVENVFLTNITHKMFLNYVNENYDILSTEMVFNDLSNLYPNISNELETLSIFGNHYAELTSVSTRNSYTNSFISTVNSSSISTISKNIIISSVSTANRSSQLWVSAQ